MNSQNNTLTIRQFPITQCLFGFILILFSVFIALITGGKHGTLPLIIIIGLLGVLLPVLFATSLAVQADRIAGTLTIRRTWLLRRYVREIPVANISAIQGEISSGRRGQPVSRIVVITKDSESVPLHFSSGGRNSKEAKAKSLREFLGVGGVEMPLGGQTSSVQLIMNERQAILTAPEAEEHTTDGVHWSIHVVGIVGAQITRWFSPDQQCHTGFVFLAQKVTGQGSTSSGLLEGLNKMIFHQLLGSYGFGSEDTPGLDSVVVQPSVDPQLEPHFTVFTSDAGAVTQFLNPGSIAALVDWATRYPLKQVAGTKGFAGQLVVMMSPRGLYVASMGNMIPETLQQMINLGVALVKGK